MSADPFVALYIAYHKDMTLPETSVLHPIRVDRTDGDTIAHRKGFSELQAQYWVWKNAAPTGYVGFFHYRRYLSLSPGELLLPPISKRPRPYQVKPLPDVSEYTPERASLLRGLDVAAPVWEYTGIPVRERYAGAPFQRREDLTLICQIIGEKYPHYAPAAEEYLSGQGEYYGNIYIMLRTVFEAYCAWLFDILDEFDRRAEDIPPRTEGYLAERLFGVWLTHHKHDPHFRWGELPRVHFSGYDGPRCYIRNQLTGLLLPPGSKRRAAVRRAAAHWK